jgi:hypothetical protein
MQALTFFPADCVARVDENAACGERDLVGAAVCALIFVIVANYGSSRGMYRGEFPAFLKDHDGKGTWLTAVDGRWKDGFRQGCASVKSPSPKDKKFVWS